MPDCDGTWFPNKVQGDIQEIPGLHKDQDEIALENGEDDEEFEKEDQEVEEEGRFHPLQFLW